MAGAVGEARAHSRLAWISRGFLNNEAHQTVKRLFHRKLWRSHPREICSPKLSGRLPARTSLGGQTRRLQPPQDGRLSPFPDSSGALHPPRPWAAAPPALELPSPRLNPQGAAATAAPPPRGVTPGQARPASLQAAAGLWGCVSARSPSRSRGWSRGWSWNSSPETRGRRRLPRAEPGRAGPIERAAPG